MRISREVGIIASVRVTSVHCLELIFREISELVDADLREDEELVVSVDLNVVLFEDFESVLFFFVGCVRLVVLLHEVRELCDETFVQHLLDFIVGFLVDFMTDPNHTDRSDQCENH